MTKMIEDFITKQNYANILHLQNSCSVKLVHDVKWRLTQIVYNF